MVLSCVSDKIIDDTFDMVDQHQELSAVRNKKKNANPVHLELPIQLVV
jgi:hypothetical protein